MRMDGIRLRRFTSAFVLHDLLFLWDSRGIEELWISEIMRGSPAVR